MKLRSCTYEPGNQESYNVTRTLTIVKLFHKNEQVNPRDSVYLFRTNKLYRLIIEICLNEFSIYTGPFHLHLDRGRDNITKYIHFIISCHC